jgi:hypothetical protein
MIKRMPLTAKPFNVSDGQPAARSSGSRLAGSARLFTDEADVWCQVDLACLLPGRLAAKQFAVHGTQFPASLRQIPCYDSQGILL